MIQVRSVLVVADNTGAKKMSCMGLIGRADKRWAGLGDIITCNVTEAIPDGIVKDGEGVKAVIVRTSAPIKRPDGSLLRFDTNAAVVIDNQMNPRGTRIFGPVAKELRDKNFLKIISLAPEAI
jgi:large subunit ribosomal protein L14